MAATLRGEGAARIETIHIPLGQETFGDVTPEILRGGWFYKTVIRNLPVSSRDALADALAMALVRPESGPVDLRQGMIFWFSEDEMPFGAIYFDRSGRRGIINSTPVSFGTDLLSRLKGILPLALE